MRERKLARGGFMGNANTREEEERIEKSYLAHRILLFVVE
jgi:hypothetical protein